MPEYNIDMIVVYTPSHQLYSTGNRLLREPHDNLEQYGRRGFSVTVSYRICTPWKLDPGPIFPIEHEPGG